MIERRNKQELGMTGRMLMKKEQGTKVDELVIENVFNDKIMLIVLINLMIYYILMS